MVEITLYLPELCRKQDLLSLRNSALEFWQDLDSVHDLHQLPGVFICCSIKHFTTFFDLPWKRMFFMSMSW